MAESIMLNKSKDFAVNIINTCREIKENKHESVILINFYVPEQV